MNTEFNGAPLLASKGTVITLAGNPDDSNSTAQPEKVVPATKTLRGVEPVFNYTMPPNSIIVLKLKTRS